MKAVLIVNEMVGTVNMSISYREGEIGKNLTPQEYLLQQRHYLTNEKTVGLATVFERCH